MSVAMKSVALDVMKSFIHLRYKQDPTIHSNPENMYNKYPTVKHVACIRMSSLFERRARERSQTRNLQRTLTHMHHMHASMLCLYPYIQRYVLYVCRAGASFLQKDFASANGTHACIITPRCVRFGLHSFRCQDLVLSRSISRNHVKGREETFCFTCMSCEVVLCMHAAFLQMTISCRVPTRSARITQRSCVRAPGRVEKV